MDAGLLEKHKHQAQMLANRTKKKYRHLRKRFFKENIDVFRLYDWDIPEIRAVVDWYAGHLVIGEYTRKQSTPKWLPMMGEAVGRALDVSAEKIHLKERRYGASDGLRYQRIDHTDQFITVNERDLRFYVNPWDYVDTGLFSDHRDTRQMVRKGVAGRDLLNLFCYTGAFTLYAAKGGARSTVSVDRSRTAIAWARRNMDLNGLSSPNHSFFQAHAFDYLSKAKARQQMFDLAVVDPPSFYSIRNRQEHFDIAQDHPALLIAVAGVMRKGGIIFFSTNHQYFIPFLDELAVDRIEEITSQTIPEDYRHKRKKIHRCWKITV
ncbi:MAG: class I SAM-dependent methyltransferase [Desulfobacteraceae bacterium]